MPRYTNNKSNNAILHSKKTLLITRRSSSSSSTGSRSDNKNPLLNNYHFQNEISTEGPTSDDNYNHNNENGTNTFHIGVVLINVIKTAFLCSVVTLYVLNQQHLLPYELSKVVSRALFWPTLPITVLKRLGRWETVIDDTVVLGGAPFAPWMPQRLHDEYNVRAIVNLCDEYSGPVRSYSRLGLRHIRLKTVDHFEPSLNYLREAIRFIKRHKDEGSRVYVHCRAGHGRSAAVVFAWLLYCYPNADPEKLNSELCRLRHVRSTLWLQPNIQAFHQWLHSQMRTGVDVCDTTSYNGQYDWERDFDESDWASWESITEDYLSVSDSDHTLDKD